MLVADKDSAGKVVVDEIEYDIDYQREIAESIKNERAKQNTIKIYKDGFDSKKLLGDYKDIDEAYDLSGGDVEEDFLKDFDCESIHNAVNMLKDEYKQALTLKYFYDMKIEDIAKIIGTTYDGARKRIKRAEQGLCKMLSEMNYEQ